MTKDTRSRRQLELIAEYRRTGSEAAFLELLQSVRGLIGMVVRRYAGSHIQTEELAAEAMVGFMMALGRFDPERGTFSATVHTYVRKTLHDCAHRLCRPVSSAGGRQERALQIHGTRLYQECIAVGIPASVAVELVAEGMGYSPQHVAAAMALHMRGVSIYEDDIGAGLADESESPDEAILTADRARLIEDLLADLPPDQAAIVRARFLGEKKARYSDLSKELGIPECRIGERERAGLAALRAGLDERGLSLAELI